MGELNYTDDQKKELQNSLEAAAVKQNGGECETYHYCRSCKERRKLKRDSETPCADAVIRMKQGHCKIREALGLK